MNTEFLSRLVWAVLIIGAGFLFYYLGNRLLLWRASRLARNAEARSPGSPQLLYFTTPDCAPCKTIQRPAVKQAQSLLGDRLQVVEINAYDQPDVARQWGVLSVPTTFIIDAQGKPRHVNHGATPANRLLAQIQEVLGPA